MTVFRKVSVKERLPSEEVVCINKYGDMLVGYVSVEVSTLDVVCESNSEHLANVEYWLEEVELPEMKDVGQEGAWCGCRDYDAGMNEILELFK